MLTPIICYEVPNMAQTHSSNVRHMLTDGANCILYYGCIPFFKLLRAVLRFFVICRPENGVLLTIVVRQKNARTAEMKYRTTYCKLTEEPLGQ